jgi:hypothetical protein
MRTPGAREGAMAGARRGHREAEGPVEQDKTGAAAPALRGPSPGCEP